MVDDFTNKWYHSKDKSDRIVILNELRSFLSARRMSEVDSDPELSAIRAKRETAIGRLNELDQLLSNVKAELAAWDARIQELEGLREKEEDAKLETARTKARAQRKNRLFTQVVGQ